MSKKKVTAVFDIGKTNKKFFLFDKDYQEVYREYIRFDEIKDEDGYPTENLEALQKWLKRGFQPYFKIRRIRCTSHQFFQLWCKFCSS